MGGPGQSKVHSDSKNPLGAVASLPWDCDQAPFACHFLCDRGSTCCFGLDVSAEAKANRALAGHFLRAASTGWPGWRLQCWEVLTRAAVVVLLWLQDSPRLTLVKHVGCISPS